MDTEEQLEVNFDKCLGRGAENVVYEATITTPIVDPESGEAVDRKTVKVAAKSLIMLQKPDFYGLHTAEKVIDLFEGHGPLAVLQRELDEHKRLSDGTPPPELVRCLGVKYEELQGVKVPMWILQELCEGGTLEARMESVRKSGEGKLLKREVFDILGGVVRCLEYIHGSGTMHRDIKPANILFRKDGSVKVADFGFVRRVGHGEKTMCGTPLFAAPEVSSGTYDQTVDIYSVAIVVMAISGVETPRIGAARDRDARGDKSGLEQIVGKLVADFPYLEPVLRAVLCPAARRPSAKELMTKLSFGAARTSASAEEHAPCGPPYYTCCCDNGDPEEDEEEEGGDGGGACQHRNDPAADQKWIFCPSCGDGGQIYHASCFNTVHCHSSLREHKATSRRLPPIMPIHFGDVSQRELVRIAKSSNPFTLYRRWSRGELCWIDFQTEVVPNIAEYVLTAVGEWAGVVAANAIVVAACGGPLIKAIFVMVGAVVGAYPGLVLGTCVAAAVLASARSDFSSKENAQAVVLAMDVLNVYVDSPKDLTSDHVKAAFRHQALLMHPDKVHKKDTETKKEFEVRKAKATINMSMLNHHYNVLSAYIQERDTSTVWTRVRANAEHSVERLWALLMERKDRKLKGLLDA